MEAIVKILKVIGWILFIVGIVLIFTIFGEQPELAIGGIAGIIQGPILIGFSKVVEAACIYVEKNEVKKISKDTPQIVNEVSTLQKHKDERINVGLGHTGKPTN